ncbi:MAG: hypothetical protein ACQXXF_07545 [Thermoplasmatota archaeon]|jgi:hypothetical protein
MDKMKYGVISIALLILLQGFAWFMGKDGVIFASISGLIGLIAGSIFGFTYKKEGG